MYCILCDRMINQYNNNRFYVFTSYSKKRINKIILHMYTIFSYFLI